MVGHADAIDQPACGDGADDVELELERGVIRAFGDLGHHCAGHRAVEQRRIPTAMDRADQVHMFKLWRSAKGDGSVFDRVQLKVQRLRDWGGRKLAVQDAAHEIKARHRQYRVVVGQLPG